MRGKVGIAPLPRLAHGPRGAGSTGGAHLGVYRGTRHPEAAVALVRFLAGEAAQRVMAAGAALTPSRMALYHEPDLVRDHPSFPEIFSLMMVAHPRPVTPYYLMLSTMLQPEFSAALVGVKTPRARRPGGTAADRASPEERSLNRRARSDRRTAALLMAPALLMLAGVTVYPALWVFWLSFQYRSRSSTSPGSPASRTTCSSRPMRGS